MAKMKNDMVMDDTAPVQEEVISTEVVDSVEGLPTHVKVTKPYIINAEGKKERILLKKRQHYFAIKKADVYGAPYAEYLWQNYKDCVVPFVAKKKE